MTISLETPPEGFIVVKSFADARSGWASFDCVLSIEDAGFTNGLRIPPGRTAQTIMQFDDTDITNGKARAVTKEEVRDLLLKARHYVSSKLMVHCHQGLSRSAAVVLGIISDRIGPGREVEAVSILLRIRPSSVCNRLIVRYADELLARGGALLKAWDDHLAKDDRAAGIMLLRELSERQSYS